jgi:hypothetical protein
MAIKRLLLPYCGCLNILQRDKARLYEVFHSFGYFYQLLSLHPDMDFGCRICERLEKRWKQWEQPLLILSWVLHPKYQFSKLNTNLPKLNWVDLSRYILYYYIVWTGTTPSTILQEFDDYRTKKFPFNDSSFNQFSDPFAYWSWISQRFKELGFVACRIMSICVNAASVERLWSSMGHLHSNRRSRLKVFSKNQFNISTNY